MGKRARKTRFVNGEGNAYELEDAVEIDLRKGPLEELLEDALTAHEDDRVIKDKAKEIKRYLKKASNSTNVLKKWYELGKILQFIDDLKLKDEDSKREAFQRLFADLNVDAERNPSPSKIIRYPGHMYMLAKIPEEIVFYEGMTWARWFDILEYKSIFSDTEILKGVVEKCCKNNWDAKTLRTELQLLNKRLKSEKK